MLWSMRGLFFFITTMSTGLTLLRSGQQSERNDHWSAFLRNRTCWSSLALPSRGTHWRPLLVLQRFGSRRFVRHILGMGDREEILNMLGQWHLKVLQRKKGTTSIIITTHGTCTCWRAYRAAGLGYWHRTGTPYCAGLLYCRCRRAIRRACGWTHRTCQV